MGICTVYGTWRVYSYVFIYLLLLYLTYMRNLREPLVAYEEQQH